MSTEPQSLFKRASLPYFLFFNFPILKSDVWRYRLDNTYTHFRALDRFWFPDPQLTYGYRQYDSLYILTSFKPQTYSMFTLPFLHGYIFGKTLSMYRFNEILNISKYLRSSFNSDKYPWYSIYWRSVEGFQFHSNLIFEKFICFYFLNNCRNELKF